MRCSALELSQRIEWLPSARCTVLSNRKDQFRGLIANHWHFPHKGGENWSRTSNFACMRLASSDHPVDRWRIELQYLRCKRSVIPLYDQPVIRISAKTISGPIGNRTRISAMRTRRTPVVRSAHQHGGRESNSLPEFWRLCCALHSAV